MVVYTIFTRCRYDIGKKKSPPIEGCSVVILVVFRVKENPI